MDYDVVKQGVYGIAYKSLKKSRNFSFLRERLFGMAMPSSDKEFIAVDYASYDVALPKEAVRGLDPTRVNSGKPFDEHYIFGMYLNDTDFVNPSLASKRVYGEDLAKPYTEEQRMEILLADKRDRIYDSHDIMTEKLCAEALLSGRYTLLHGGDQVFPIASSLLSVAGAQLSTAPLKVLGGAAKTLAKTAGATPKLLILNGDDAVSVLASDEWQKILDNRRIEGNIVRFADLDETGASYCGTILVPGCGAVTVLSYNGGYKDPANGTYKYFLPQGSAYFGPEQVGGVGHCGVFADLGDFTGNIPAEHGQFVWNDNGPLPHNTNIQVQSAPAPVITEIDRYCILTGIS